MTAAQIIACITAAPFILGLLAVAALLIDFMIFRRDRWMDPPKSPPPRRSKSSSNWRFRSSNPSVN